MTTATAPTATAAPAAFAPYNDAQVAALMTSGLTLADIVAAMAAQIPHGTLSAWADDPDTTDVSAAIAAHVEAQALAAANAAAAAAKEAERLKNLPIKIRPGVTAGDLRKAGKQAGQPYPKSTQALLSISPAPWNFQACLPAQIASILSDPITALTAAIDCNSGKHDGKGADARNAAHSASDQLSALLDAYQSAASLLTDTEAIRSAV